MFVIILILLMKMLSFESRELVMHRFESVNDSITSDLQAISSPASSFYECKLIDNNALKSNCDGFSCWESQLRDTTRTQLLNVFDEFRSKVFDTHYCGRLKNTKHRSIFQMEWHWKLEMESRHFLKDCPVRSKEKNIIMNLNARDTQLPRNNEQNHLSFVCELAATSFPVQSGSQSELIRSLPKILDDNLLDDFDPKTDEYRRVHSLYVGCSYMLRHNVTSETAMGTYVVRGAIGHFSCMFCAPEHVNIEKHCPNFTKKSEKDAKLCKLIVSSTEMPCELNSVQCPLPEKSLTWMFTPKTLVGIFYENQTYKIYSKKLDMDVDLNEDDYQSIRFPSMVPVTVTPYVTHIDLYDRKFCLLLCLVYIFVLSLLCLLLVLIYKNKVILRLYFHMASWVVKGGRCKNLMVGTYLPHNIGIEVNLCI